jgi:aryl-alcohol dehydrogenase-like predicted oxidoreductase
MKGHPNQGHNPLYTHRTIGRGGPSVFPLGLGCMGMSEFYAGRSDEESIACIHRALELGVNHFDTSDAYGRGENEKLIRRAFAGGRRENVMLATKFGFVRNEKGEFIGVRGDPEYVRSCCEASLRRLEVDHVDLYYLHRVDPNTPIEETVGAMAELVKEGKVRYLGLSEAAPTTIRRAHATHPIAALQTEYSLWSRDPEGELLALCRDLGITFVAYSPLGRGFLTGQIRSFDDLAPDDFRRNTPRFQGENFEKNLHLVDRVKKIAARKGATPSQLALAWVLSQGDHILPIPGTKRRKYLEDNLGALNVTLTAEELREINAACPPELVVGNRNAAASMKAMNL